MCSTPLIVGTVFGKLGGTYPLLFIAGMLGVDGRTSVVAFASVATEAGTRATAGATTGAVVDTAATCTNCGFCGCCWCWCAGEGCSASSGVAEAGTWEFWSCTGGNVCTNCVPNCIAN